MKLWEKGIDTAKFVEDFTVGKDRELDLLLAPWDVLGNLAHAQMLHSIDILTADELAKLRAELIHIYQEIQKGNFQIEDGVEDVHSQIEFMLTQKLGDIGKKIHTGRSRNDQVLLDLKLFIRHEIQEIAELSRILFQTLTRLSDRYKAILLPGYTHLQIAMPSSFGLWFGAYAESLTDDLLLLQSAYKIVNQNPLGSGAGYGSSFPLDRQLTTDLLGFDALNYNVVYAQMGRGKVEKIVAFALANLAATIAKMAMDVTLYINQNFGFISFSDEFTTGSSIMPHKKNPDVFELIRSKCNKLQALPNEIALVLGNLPSGYHRDLQTIKESFLPAFADFKQILSVANLVLENIQVKEDIVTDQKYQYLFSVEEVNKLVLKGVPFREAYRQLAEKIQNNTYQPDLDIQHSHEGSIGNLSTEKITAKMQEVYAGFAFEEVEQTWGKLLNN